LDVDPPIIERDMIIGNNNEPLPEVIVEPPDMEKVLIDLTKRAITSFFILFQGTIIASEVDLVVSTYDSGSTLIFQYSNIIPSTTSGG
jgi:hypothetical protein